MNASSTEPPTPIHRPVLLDEVVHWLAPREGAVIVDGTVGAGGHASVLAEKVGTRGLVLGLDRDPAMLALAKVKTRGQPVVLIQSPYDELDLILNERSIESIDGILLDLGLSSDQLAWSERGFGFASDGPLDMRFDPADERSETAFDLINRLPAEPLANLFYEYGEERLSRRIARKIVETRQSGPIRTTSELANLVRRCYPPPARRGPIDPATRVFQALRIAVNHELERLDMVLGRLGSWLKPGGRAAIISFHSLEDRRVKHAFRDDPTLAVLTKKPITASVEELRVNPRARSAKLRVAERWISATTMSRQDEGQTTG